MSKILLGLSLVVCAASANAAKFPVCVDFSAAGYCDAMQYDGKKAATWHNYDCAGSAGVQTTAKYKKGTTTCDGGSGCNPAQAYGWDSLDWTFDLGASTGTLTGMFGGSQYILQQDMPVAISKAACSVSRTKGGVSVLAH